MSNPTTRRLPLAALGVVLVQLLTFVLMAGADEVQAERSDVAREAEVTRCGDRP